ncbi:hypothetical protein VTJ49DRAFT_3423 [Mycothermus thermophilus]|uniref:C2H2-type domain-containing protein n=1 Tax=Humicola insolens TaxID=85995 RepID=A0ABR3V7J1_HUMIN
MCKIRTVHYTLHDHRRLISMQLFSSPDEDVLVGGSKSRVCNCPPDFASEIPEHADNVRRLRGLSPCSSHHPCCLCHRNVTLCQAYLDKHGLKEHPRTPEGGWTDLDECPNTIWLDHFHKIGALFPEGSFGHLDEDDWHYIPTFPADELFYSDDITQCFPANPDSSALQVDRVIACNGAMSMHTSKLKLKDAIETADNFLDAFENYLTAFAVNQSHFRNKAPLNDDQLHHLMWWCKKSKDTVSQVESAELQTALLYVGVMKYASSTLEALQRLPAPGESIRSRDGRCSLSREQLDHGKLTPREAIAACDGPLKQRDALQTRLMNCILRVLRLRAGRQLSSPPRTSQVLPGHRVMKRSAGRQMAARRPRRNSL